jgi:spoIIIJ-associated protein
MNIITTPDEAKTIIEDVFRLLCLTYESIDYTQDEKRGVIFTINSYDLERISRGKDFVPKDLVFILKRIFNKGAGPGEDTFKCTIDINGEQSRIDERIKMRALNAAEQAKSFKTDVELDPMSSYERMIVHNTLSDKLDITTESVGEGKNRKVVVKYLAI